MSRFSCQFAQVILYVQDMDREVRFYHDVLGFSIRYPKNKANYANEMWVELETGSTTLALHGGEDEQPDDKHELVFVVDDIQSARQTLLDAGITMSEVRLLEDGAPIASGFDPAGHGFSIRER